MIGMVFDMIGMVFDMIGVRDECQHGDANPVSQQFAECAPPLPCFLGEGLKKNTIESVIMIIPRRTPPPSFFENCHRP